MREQAMANAQDKARDDLEQARARVTEWDRALEQAKTARDRAEDSAPDDPSVLEGFADEYARAEGRVRAAVKGRQQAEAGVLATLESVVRASLDDARAEVKAAEQAHAAHRKKLDALLAKVSELDGADYRPVTLDDLTSAPEVGVKYSVKASTAVMLQARAREQRKVVELLERVLAQGDLSPGDRGKVPTYALEYVDARRAAGIATADEVATAVAMERERLEDEAAVRESEDQPRGWRTRFTLPGLQSTGALG